ncbi:MAG: hypothetical protein FWF81_01210 [Defluviitaleaceae bacterium]|nr:hypothetical protein [Defluviitaleaceae bacterium]
MVITITQKQRKAIIVSFIILLISFAISAISTIIDVFNNGWENVSVLNIVPLIGMIVIMIAILYGAKEKNID